MDRNAFLAFALSFAVLTAWMLFTGPAPRPPEVAPPPAAAPPPAPQAADVPPEAGGAPGLPEPPRAGGEAPAPSPQPALPATGEVVEIDTPLVRAELDSVGGVLRHLELKGFRVAPAADAPPLALATCEGTSSVCGSSAARVRADADVSISSTRLRSASSRAHSACRNRSRSSGGSPMARS